MKGERVVKYINKIETLNELIIPIWMHRFRRVYTDWLYLSNSKERPIKSFYDLFTRIIARLWATWSTYAWQIVWYICAKMHTYCMHVCWTVLCYIILCIVSENRQCSLSNRIAIWFHLTVLMLHRRPAGHSQFNAMQRNRQMEFINLSTHVCPEPGVGLIFVLDWK